MEEQIQIWAGTKNKMLNHLCLHILKELKGQGVPQNMTVGE